MLQSRQLRPLSRYFPEIVTALDTEFVLDGELICWRRGRLDFSALQRRQIDAGEFERRPTSNERSG